MPTEILGLILGVIVGGITSLVNFIKSKLNAKMRVNVEKIAVIIEQLYNGCSSNDKLKAFKELCRAKSLNVARAVEYLEKYIIPISKDINRYEVTTNVKEDEKVEVTN